MGKRRYSIEFKKEAVQLMVLDGLSAGEVSSKLGISRSGYYGWRSRAPSARRIEDEAIKEAILKVHKEAKGSQRSQGSLWAPAHPSPSAG